MREKLFGLPLTGGLDRNTRFRIMMAARAYNVLHKQPGQHIGPLTRAAFDVLHALVFGFANAKTGACFPSLERIAAKAGCARSTAAKAIRLLEEAGILTWVHRVRREAGRVLRSSNAYRFFPGPASKSENQIGTQTPVKPEENGPTRIIVLDPRNPLDAALIALGRGNGALAV